jgi:integrase
MRTVAELIDAWLVHADGRLEVATMVGYRSAARQLVPLIGAVALHELTTADLDRLCADLRAGGRAPSTVDRYYRVLHAALRQGVRWGWLAANPADATSAPRVRRRQIRPPAAADVVRLIDYAAASGAPDLAVALRLLVATGMRRGEVCGQRWRDIDLEAGTLRIEGSVVHAAVGVVEADTKTHQARRLTLDSGTAAVLRRHLQTCRARGRGLGVSLAPDAFVLSDASDGREPWRPNRLTQAFARLRTQLGIDGVRLHDLRHFQATELIAAGVDVRTVAGRLGHADPSTTLRIYAAFMEPADQAAARVIEALLGGRSRQRSAVAGGDSGVLAG